MTKKVFISAVSALTLLSATSSFAGSSEDTKAEYKAQYKADKETCRYLVNQRKHATREKAEFPNKTIKTSLAMSEDKTLSNRQNLLNADAPERTLKRSEHNDDSNAVVKAMKNAKQTVSAKTETFKYKLVSECMKDKGHV